MEVERVPPCGTPDYVIFQNEDGTYWANVKENACSDDLPSIEEARQWALTMLEGT
jgi:hypothetical protein